MYISYQDSPDQTGGMYKLIWVYAGCVCHKIVFYLVRFICIDKLT